MAWRNPFFFLILMNFLSLLDRNGSKNFFYTCERRIINAGVFLFGVYSPEMNIENNELYTVVLQQSVIHGTPPTQHKKLRLSE